MHLEKKRPLGAVKGWRGLLRDDLEVLGDLFLTDVLLLLLLLLLLLCEATRSLDETLTQGVRSLSTT